MDSQHKKSAHVKLPMWCSATQYTRIKGTKVMSRALLTSVLGWIEWWVNFRLACFTVDKITIRTPIGSSWEPQAVRSGRETVITVPTGDRVTSHAVSSHRTWPTEICLMMYLKHRVYRNTQSAIQKRVNTTAVVVELVLDLRQLVKKFSINQAPYTRNRAVRLLL